MAKMRGQHQREDERDLLGTETEAEDLQLTDGTTDDEDEGGSLLFADAADAEDEEDQEDGGDDEAAEGEDDGEEEEEPPAPKRRARRKKMSEYGGEHGAPGGFSGREDAEVMALREQVAEMRYRLYERDVEETLEQWGKGRFQFSEGARKQLSEAEGRFAKHGSARVGRIALSRAFISAYREFMRKQGIRLSEGMRGDLNGLLETALSSAIVDLSERGSSFDQETRVTRGGPNASQETQANRLEDTAERMAQAQYHKGVIALSEPEKLEIYSQASRAIGY